MQATQVKQAANSKQSYSPIASQQADQAKGQASKQESTLEPSRLELVQPQTNSSRMFEAFNDCV
jgi:hypothetical protein